MRVFLTGATGFVGTAVIQQLLGAGHRVLGLTRSDAGAQSLTAAGVEVHRGDLEDLDSLRSGAAQSDGVIHCGFVHDFSRFQEVCAIDTRAIETLGSVLAGSARPLIITSGTGMGIAAPGQLASEDYFNPNHPNPRTASEVAGAKLTANGGNVIVIRLPQVHDPVKQGLITYMITVAREKGVSAYSGDGQNRWAAVHVSDAALLYRLALEKGTPGARYHAVGEQGVPVRDIAEAIGRGLKIPVESKPPEHFGWLGMFAAYDMPASSALTQQRLDWHPTGPALISDLDQMRYFEA
jgi:nucleoside-diphosphate-sugar epimerase